MGKDLTTKTVNGLKWSSASTIINSLMQIGYTAVMARLLDPAAFGLVALSGVVLRFAGYFAQMGMGQALIQKKDLTQDDIRSAFTSSIILGVTFAGIIWLLAPLATLIFDNEQVVPIVKVMAISFVITGLSTTSISLLRRRMQFKSLAIIEIAAYIIAYVGVGVVLGYLGFGVWSLVYASLTSATIIALLSYLMVRHSVVLLVSWKHYKPLFAFGSKVSLISFFEFLGANMDTIIIGRLLGASSLGIYNRAYMLVSLPIQYLTNSISRVLFPAFSKLQSEISKLKNVYLSAITIVTFIIVPACVGICVAAERIVWVLLGDGWTAAVPVLQILALSVPITLISHFGGILCEATNTLKVKIYLQFFNVSLLPLLFFVLYKFGLVGIAYAILITSVIKQIAYIFIAKHILKFKLGEALSAFVPGLLSATTVGFAIYCVDTSLSVLNAPKLLILVLDIVVGAIALFCSLFFSSHSKLRQEIGSRLEKGLSNNRSTIMDKVVFRSIQVLS